MRKAVAGVILITGSFLSPVESRSQPNASFAFFASLSPSRYSHAEGKLTYVGRQFSLKPTIAFAVTGAEPDVSRYEPFRFPGIRYSNDDFANNIVPVHISPAGIDSMLSRLSVLPEITDGGVDKGHILSFALYHDGSSAGPQVFDTILNEANAVVLLGALRLAWDDQPETIQPLAAFGCGSGLLSGAAPRDMTSSVQTTIDGVRLQQATGLFVGTIRIRNTSGSTLAAPVSLVVNTHSGAVRLENATGRTCRITPGGQDFINLPGSLAANSTATLTVRLRNPGMEDIQITTKVFSGPGER